MKINIRKALPQDADAIWSVLEPIIRKGESFAFKQEEEKDAILSYWLGADKFTYVALMEDRVLGSFLIKENQPGLGSHIANASYAVSPEVKGKGIGQAMGAYSLEEARRLGFQAMQFNLVVSSNEVAVKLWKQLGFTIIGEIPEAFQHPSLGLTKAYIMYQKLEPK